MNLNPGMYINNRYEIINKVGSGGMADVYKAMDHTLNRHVAIKVLKEEFSSDTNFVSKFRAEARAAAGLSHLNIVNVYDVGEENGINYIVMELIEGITLKQFIATKGKLGVKESVGIAIQIAQGMEAAHAKHIIHRDIKPQNIILSKDGLAKVTDFGIAKTVTSNTITTNAVGSVHYISPEQARGGYSDEKSDIYSLAVTLYEMLVGRVPFVGDNTVNVAIQHIQEEPTPLREIDPSIPISIEKIVQKCLQKKPERRYQSATELIADLKYAIRNPEEDFVDFSQNPQTDSPTLVLTPEELEHIKGASVDQDSLTAPERRREASRETQGRRAAAQRGEKKEDDDEIDPKLEKIMVGGGIALVAILALIIIFLIGKGIGLFRSGDKNPENPTQTEEPATTPEETKEMVQIPTVMGDTKEDAESKLKAAGFVVTFSEQANSTFEVGQVIGTDPESGTELEKGSSVEIIVCSGAEEIALPDLTDYTSSAASDILTNLGLKVEEEHEFNEEVEEGNLIKTDPAAEEKVKKGDTVTLIISKGPESKIVEVPDLYNKTKAQAQQALEAVKLVLNNVTESHSNDVPAGNVISQGTAKGTKVNEGSTVDIVISLGPEKVSKYYGTLSIGNKYNPFENPEDEGTIDLKLTQGDNSEFVYATVTTYEDFSNDLSSLRIEGFASGKGTVTMYLDGAKCDGEWIVNFSEE